MNIYLCINTQTNLLQIFLFSKLSCMVCAGGRTASVAGRPPPPPGGRTAWPRPRISHPPAVRVLHSRGQGEIPAIVGAYSLLCHKVRPNVLRWLFMAEGRPIIKNQRRARNDPFGYFVPKIQRFFMA